MNVRIMVEIFIQREMTWIGTKYTVTQLDFNGPFETKRLKQKN